MKLNLNFSKFFKLLALLIILQLSLKAQKVPAKAVQAGPVPPLAETIANYDKLMPFEKLFLHIDKPYYSATDTVWFKAYLLNGLSNVFSSQSGLIYIELISASNTIVKRISVPADIGLSWGQLALDETIESGDYTLRGYTNWMQNFGPETFFTKKIYISNQKKQKLLITQKQNIENLNGKQILNVDLRLKDLDNADYGLKNFNWTIQEGANVLGKKAVQTTIDGKFSASLPLPEKINEPLKLIIEDKITLVKTVIPLSYGAEGDVDLQFMPEGGQIIAGLPTTIGFKAIAKNGLGTDVAGTITDSKNKEVVSFKSLHKGMGKFNLVAIPGEAYTAKIALKDGTVKSFMLPQTKTSGVTLKVVNTNASDSLHLTVNFSEDYLNGQKYHLLGLVNNVTVFQVNFTAERPKVNTSLPKKNFPSGIVHFTIFNDQNQPLSERMVFINNNDNLNISITPSKSVYKVRDSIALNVDIKDDSGNPAPTTSLSVAVTDDGQVKLDSLENNLITNTLLTSGLKGTIEDPAYYFSGAADATENLDLVLLTQGWTRYNWLAMLRPQPQPSFQPEHQFAVSGEVTNLLGKPMAGSKVTVLFTEKGRMTMMDTLSNTEGKFVFDKFPKLDTVAFFVQARNLKDKKNNVAIHLNQFRPPKVSSKLNFFKTPWYINTDTTTLKFVKNDERIKKQKFSLSGINQLDDVVIEGKNGVKVSKNLNGPGEADQIIDEEQIAAAGKITLFNLLLKKVTGIYLKTSRGLEEEFYLGGRRVNIVIDGVLTSQFFDGSDGILFSEYLKNILDGIKLDDVTGIEVMSGTKNIINYDNMLDQDPGIAMGTAKNAYIEITTRSGKGMFFKSKQNVADYKPVPINWPKEFYRPRYTPASINSPILDLRSTIFWQPQLLTSKTGTAFTSFFSADKPGIYTVIVQGTNLKGLVGYKMIKLNVK